VATPSPATLQFLQPVSGLVLAAVVLGEDVTVPIAVGSALIVAGIVVAQRV
jgi:drug/metabolite transporter (DMT)-like permease